MKKRSFWAGLSIVLGLVAVGGLLSLFGRPVHADSLTLSVTDVADVGSLTAEVVDDGHGAAPGPAAIPRFSPGNCTVTSTLDSGVGSLRACMAQLGAGDVITFDTAIFPPGNPQTITLSSALPDIVTDNVTIDGSNAGVILDGNWTPGETGGLVIDGASNVVIKGLQILNFPGDGIWLRNGASNNTIGGTNATPGGSCSGDCNLISGSGLQGVAIDGSGTMSNTVSGNYIGTNAAGTAAIGNTQGGFWICCGAQYNLIGGDTAGERNLISGNLENGVVIVGSSAMSNTVSGNYIGTDSSGTALIGNTEDGVHIDNGAQYNVIGGDTAGARNLISGNGWSGVCILGGSGTAMNNTVSGNYIGTDVNGTAAISNTYDGVYIGDGAQYNVIGGDTADKRNLISGNGDSGVLIQYSGTMSNTVSGNYIGTDASGTAALGNRYGGVGIVDGAQWNIIGGDTPGERNLISGNQPECTTGACAMVISTGAMSNTVQGNYIGTDVSGTSALPNCHAVDIRREGTSGNVVINNLISGNQGIGVTIRRGAMRSTIIGNNIGTDVNGTSALPNNRGLLIYQGAQCNVIERNIIGHNTSSGVGIGGGDPSWDDPIKNTVT